MTERALPIAAGVLWLVVMSASIGCSKSGDGETNAGDQTTQPSNADDVTIPTQDEADAEAAEAINEENADDVFEQLQNEIDAEAAEDDGNGDG